MISKKIEKALNEQIVLEADAAFTYLAMASWADVRGMEGAAKFFQNHAAEEQAHMMKIVTFINEVGGTAVIPAVKKPAANYKSIEEACRKAYDHEQKVTEAIHSIVEMAQKEKDHVADEFLRWFIEEQKEEEVLFMRVIDKIALIGKGGQANYFVDLELAGMAAANPGE